MNTWGSGFIPIVNYGQIQQGNIVEQFLLLTDGTELLLTDNTFLELA